MFIPKEKSLKSVQTCTRMRRNCACTQQNVGMYVYASCAKVHAGIFNNKKMLVLIPLLSYDLKFQILYRTQLSLPRYLQKDNDVCLILNPLRYWLSDQCFGMGGRPKRPSLDIWLFQDLIRPTYATIKT